MYYDLPMWEHSCSNGSVIHRYCDNSEDYVFIGSWHSWCFCYLVFGEIDTVYGPFVTRRAKITEDWTLNIPDLSHLL